MNKPLQVLLVERARSAAEICAAWSGVEITIDFKIKSR